MAVPRRLPFLCCLVLLACGTRVTLGDLVVEDIDREVRGHCVLLVGDGASFCLVGGCR